MPLAGSFTPKQSAIILICIGIGLAASVGYHAKLRHDDYADAEVAEGVVIRENYGRAHVAVQYTNARGERVSFNENSVFGYDVGERVAVKYFANDRIADATTADFNGMYGWTIFLGGAGLVMALAGAIYLLATR